MSLIGNIWVLFVFGSYSFIDLLICFVVRGLVVR